MFESTSSSCSMHVTYAMRSPSPPNEAVIVQMPATSERDGLLDSGSDIAGPERALALIMPVVTGPEGL